MGEETRSTPDSSAACGALGMTVNEEPRAWPHLSATENVRILELVLRG